MNYRRIASATSAHRRWSSAGWALRRNTTGVSVSALVRYTKIQPITTTPDGILNRFTGASGIRCWTRCQVHGG